MRAKITRYTCETCGKTEDMEGHCDDYDYWPSGWWSLRPRLGEGAGFPQVHAGPRDFCSVGCMVKYVTAMNIRDYAD